jgi:hypothetical protein
MFIEVTKKDGTGVRLLNINHICQISGADGSTLIKIHGDENWVEITDSFSSFKDRLLRCDIVLIRD